MIADELPELVERVRGIGFTTRTCGLPFVLPKAAASPALAAHYVEALQQAYSQTSQAAKNCLHLTGFEAVTFDDYAGILELESYALEHGIAMLK